MWVVIYYVLALVNLTVGILGHNDTTLLVGFSCLILAKLEELTSEKRRIRKSVDAFVQEKQRD